MVTLLLLALVVAVGSFSIGILVQGLRQNRDDAGLDEQRASLVAERAAGTEAGRDETACADLPADTATSLTGYTTFI